MIRLLPAWGIPYRFLRLNIYLGNGLSWAGLVDIPHSIANESSTQPNFKSSSFSFSQRYAFPPSLESNLLLDVTNVED